MMVMALPSLLRSLCSKAFGISMPAIYLISMASMVAVMMIDSFGVVGDVASD